MLGKLIKYDVRFGAKKYAFMAAMTAALLIVAVIAYAVNIQVVSGLFIFLAVIATIAYAIMYLVVSVQHLYRQLCSRESYLTYSLPVSPHSLIQSKLIAIVFWGVVTSVVVILFWLVAVNGMILSREGLSLGSIWDTATNYMRGEAGIELSPFVAQVLVMGVLQFGMNVCLMAFSVSLANVPFLKERNWGVAAGVTGFIVLTNIAGLTPVFIWWLIEKIGGSDIFAITSGPQVNTMMSGLTWISAASYIVFAAVFYFLTVRMVDKHRFIG